MCFRQRRGLVRNSPWQRLKFLVGRHWELVGKERLLVTKKDMAKTIAENVGLRKEHARVCQVATDDKSNEITAIPQLLDQINVPIIVLLPHLTDERSCRPTSIRSVSDRSPIILRIGSGSFRTSVGMATIWSSLPGEDSR